MNLTQEEYRLEEEIDAIKNFYPKNQWEDIKELSKLKNDLQQVRCQMDLQESRIQEEKDG